VDARNNWWGQASGPGLGLADSVSGRVATVPFLSIAPSGLPGLAPPLVASRSLGASPVIATAVTAAPAPARQPLRAAKQPRRAPPSILTRPGMSAEQAARVQQQAQREAAHEARRAEREAERAARFQARERVQPQAKSPAGPRY